MTNKLLLVFIHGFRGSDTSFKDFPNWLKTSLHDTMNMDVETIVYPSYKTTGDLSLAVRNFSAWLIDQTKNKENLDIILLGHSMGGIVGAETILLFDGRRHDNPLGSASIIGLLAYDTPFYSVNQDSLSSAALSQVDKYSRYIPSSLLSSSNNSRSTSSSSPLSLTWDTTSSITTSQSSSSTKKWGLFAGAVGAVGVAAVGAYLTRDKIASTVSDAYDQLEFVSALMDRNGCHKRMNALLEVPDIFVRCFYIQIPSEGTTNRTFIALPPADTMYVFIPMVTKVESEIIAHTSIFDPKKNDYYYTVGSDSITLIAEMVARHGRKKQHSTGPVLDLDLD